MHSKIITFCTKFNRWGVMRLPQIWYLFLNWKILYLLNRACSCLIHCIFSIIFPIRTLMLEVPFLTYIWIYLLIELSFSCNNSKIEIISIVTQLTVHCGYQLKLTSCMNDLTHIVIHFPLDSFVRSYFERVEHDVRYSWNRAN